MSERLGLHEDTYSVSIPLGATINMAGAAIYLASRAGDYVVGDATLNRFFSFHVIAVPLVLLTLFGEPGALPPQVMSAWYPGGAALIGGLIDDNRNENETKIPGLGDIPLLSWLFKTQSTANQKTNLFVFLTPRVVKNPAEQYLPDVVEEFMNTMAVMLSGAVQAFADEARGIRALLGGARVALLGLRLGRLTERGVLAARIGVARPRTGDVSIRLVS